MDNQNNKNNSHSKLENLVIKHQKKIVNLFLISSTICLGFGGFCDYYHKQDSSLISLAQLGYIAAALGYINAYLYSTDFNKKE